MPAPETIASLAERKAALLSRSEENRQALVADVEKLRPLADWVDFGIGTAHKVRKGWEIAGPLVAALKSTTSTSRSESTLPLAGTIHRISGAISLVRSIVELWRK